MFAPVRQKNRSTRWLSGFEIVNRPAYTTLFPPIGITTQIKSHPQLKTPAEHEKDMFGDNDTKIFQQNPPPTSEPRHSTPSTMWRFEPRYGQKNCEPYTNVKLNHRALKIGRHSTSIVLRATQILSQNVALSTIIAPNRSSKLELSFVSI